jgi:hypothetical protein
MSGDGVVRFVQFPHPGSEHVPPADGYRRWQRGDAPHRRTFVVSDGTYRSTAEGPDRRDEVQFWGEWEGAASTVRRLGHDPPYPRWLCRPQPYAQQPVSDDGTPPQNTDPFVWGDAMRYSVCRQPTNRKLRNLAPGSLILFGSSLGGEFVLDTVLVVAEAVPHSRTDHKHLPTSPHHMRATIEPWYGWDINETIFKMYVGATPANPIEGMFSFVPSLPADADGFPRPDIRLPLLVNPALRMQAACTTFDNPGDVAPAWNEVVRQVLTADLALATQLDLPSSKKGLTDPEFDGVSIRTLRAWAKYWKDEQVYTRHGHSKESAEASLALITAELVARLGHE